MPSEPTNESKVNLQLEQAIQAILNDRPIAYHASLARALGSVTAGVLLSQLLYWQPRSKDSEGWFWKTRDEIYDETGLTRFEQETARKTLVKAGVVEEKRRGVPAKMHFRVNLSRVVELLSGYQKAKGRGSAGGKNDPGDDAPIPGHSQLAENHPSSWRESSQLDGGKPPIKTAGNHPTITETTPETSTSNTTETTISNSFELQTQKFNERQTSKFSKKRDNFVKNDALEAEPLTPQRKAQSRGLTPIADALSARAQKLAPRSPKTAKNQPAAPQSDSKTGPSLEGASRPSRGRPRKYPLPPDLELFTRDITTEFHDLSKLPSNLSFIGRVLQESGLTPSFLYQLMQEARQITKGRGDIDKPSADEPGFRNRFPYFRKTLIDLIEKAGRPVSARRNNSNQRSGVV